VTAVFSHPYFHCHRTTPGGARHTAKAQDRSAYIIRIDTFNNTPGNVSNLRTCWQRYFYVPLVPLMILLASVYLTLIDFAEGKIWKRAADRFYPDIEYVMLKLRPEKDEFYS